MLSMAWSNAIRCVPTASRSLALSWTGSASGLRQSYSRLTQLRCASGPSSASGASGAKVSEKSNKLLYIGTAGVIVSVTLLAYQHHDQSQVRDRKKPAKVTAVKNNDTADNFGLKNLTLYQFQSCPFCCKVRTFLDYYGISYDKVEVNSVTKEELGFAAYRKVPLLVFDNVASALYNRDWTAFPDSSLIITTLYNSFLTKKAISDADGPIPDMRVVDTVKARDELKKLDVYTVNYGSKARSEAALLQRDADEAELEVRWRKWVDDVFVHTISPNIYRTLDESIDSFRQFERVGNWAAQFNGFDRFVIVYVGAFVMWLVGSQLKKKHKLADDVRSSLYTQTNEFLTAIEQANSLRFDKAMRTKQRNAPKRDQLLFLGGAEPNLADLAMYAAVSSFDGTQAFEDLAENTNLVSWYDEVKRLVETHHGRTKLSASTSGSSK